MGSFYEKPPTLDDDGRKPTRARLGSYCGAWMEKKRYNSYIFLQFFFVCTANLSHSEIESALTTAFLYHWFIVDIKLK